MLDFEPLALKNKNLFDSFIIGRNYNHSEASFSNMFTWQHAWDIKMAIENNGLYISMDSEIYRPFLLPPYTMNEDSILPYMQVCEDYMLSNFGDFYLKCATPQMVERIKKDCGDRYVFEYDEYNTEYVYNSSDLIELKGKKYHSKRNHINGFLRKYTSEFALYEPKYKEECLKIQDDWAIKKEIDKQEAQEEYESIEKALDNYEELGFIGCVIKIGGEVVAYSFGERICDSTAIIHIEKAKGDIDGLYTYINREFVANCFSDCKFINRAEDMGIAGIRQAKRSYHPVLMLEKYDIILKK